jgi:hypothetical protein
LALNSLGTGANNLNEGSEMISIKFYKNALNSNLKIFYFENLFQIVEMFVFFELFLLESILNSQTK